MMQNILKTEIRMPTRISIQPVVDWFLEGLRSLIPPQFRSAGWGPSFILHKSGRDNIADQQLVVEQSILGESRISEEAQTSDTLPIKVELPAEQIFFTCIDFPQGAGRNLEQAIRLRFDEISPISTDYASFAYHRRPQASNGRISVDVAIVKSKTITEIQEKLTPNKAHEIGAAANASGRMKFIFERDKNPGLISKLSNRLRRAGFFVLSFLLLIGAFDMHLSRRSNALMGYESLLVTELRQMRKTAVSLGGVGNNDFATSLPLAEAMDQLNQKLSSTPEGVLIENLELNTLSFTAAGYAPEATSKWSDEKDSLNLQPSEHSGFLKFQWSAANGAPQ